MQGAGAILSQVQLQCGTSNCTSVTGQLLLGTCVGSIQRLATQEWPFQAIYATVTRVLLVFCFLFSSLKGGVLLLLISSNNFSLLQIGYTTARGCHTFSEDQNFSQKCKALSQMRSQWGVLIHEEDVTPLLRILSLEVELLCEQFKC